MAVIVENGSIVENANSYISIVELQSYASDRNISLGSDTSAINAMVIQATDYLESLQDDFVGEIFDVNQELSWPRQGVEFRDQDISGTIPKILKKACMQLSIDIFNGITFNQTADGRFILEESAGPLRVRYADTLSINGGGNGVQAEPIAALKTLKPLLKSSLPGECSGGFNIRVCR